MYGKSYESMYSGSMVGAGLNVFAVWNYIITKAQFGVIELNPRLVHAILGGELEDVIDAIDYLSRPDPESRSKDEDGRRIVKEGQFQYRVVNWVAYQAMKNAEDLREYNRRKQSEYRARKRLEKQKSGGKPLPGEQGFTKAVERNGDADPDRYGGDAG